MSKRPPPQHIRINGAELHYIEEGRGEPVIFVHGGLGDFRTWGPQMAPFAAHYRAISYSRRAHYPNAWPPDYTQCALAGHAADLQALITRLSGGPVHLVANSYGGYICLWLATQQPGLVRSLALAEPPLHPLLRRLPEGAALFAAFMTGAWQPAGRAFAAGNREEGVRCFLDGALGPGAFDELPPPVRRRDDAQCAGDGGRDADPVRGLHARPARRRAAGHFGPHPAAARRAQPDHVPPDQRRPGRPSAPRCASVIPAASHVLHSDNPAAHNAAVLAFLARHQEGLNGIV